MFAAGRVVEPGEPLWLPEDRDIVLGWFEYRRTLCPGCGLPRDETHGGEFMHAFTAEVTRCQACATRERAGTEYAKKAIKAGGDTAGLEVAVYRH